MQAISKQIRAQPAVAVASQSSKRSKNVSRSLFAVGNAVVTGGAAMFKCEPLDNCKEINVDAAAPVVEQSYGQSAAPILSQSAQAVLPVSLPIQPQQENVQQSSDASAQIVTTDIVVASDLGNSAASNESNTQQVVREYHYDLTATNNNSAANASFNPAEERSIREFVRSELEKAHLKIQCAPEAVKDNNNNNFVTFETPVVQQGQSTATQIPVQQVQQQQHFIISSPTQQQSNAATSTTSTGSSETVQVIVKHTAPAQQQIAQQQIAQASGTTSQLVMIPQNQQACVQRIIPATPVQQVASVQIQQQQPTAGFVQQPSASFVQQPSAGFVQPHVVVPAHVVAAGPRLRARRGPFVHMLKKRDVAFFPDRNGFGVAQVRDKGLEILHARRASCRAGPRTYRQVKKYRPYSRMDIFNSSGRRPSDAQGIPMGESSTAPHLSFTGHSVSPSIRKSTAYSGESISRGSMSRGSRSKSYTYLPVSESIKSKKSSRLASIPSSSGSYKSGDYSYSSSGSRSSGYYGSYTPSSYYSRSR